jgi:UDP-N-acetylmuramate--alanine ligase
MSPLAELLHQAGYAVQGSDLSDSAIVGQLKARGISVMLGHAPENLGGATAVVRSSAVPDSNPEVAAARSRGLPVVKLSELVGQLSQTRRTLAVAGTHGKTTTTAMLASILIAAGREPSVLIGGVLPALGSGAQVGQSDLLVVEADEFDRRFLALHPEIAVITSVEADHLDYYGTVEAMRSAFADFSDRIPPEGWLVLNADDPGAAALATRHLDRTVTYGLSERADWRAAGITPNGQGGNDFVVYAHELLVGSFSLPVPGQHNVANAVAAAVAAGRIGVDFTTAAAALAEFRGVQRRLERLGIAGGVTVVDDYAHHPTKVRASLAALREQSTGRIICVFQPHQYQRLSGLFRDFSRAFADADLVLVSDVYAPAGRGPATGERTAEDLARAIVGPKAEYVGPLTAAVTRALALAQPGDLIVTMGAGDVTTAGPALLRLLSGKPR